MFIFLSFHKLTDIGKVHPEMIGNCSLGIAVLFNCLGNLQIALFLVFQNGRGKYLIQGWPVRVALAPGYLRYVLMLPQMIHKSVSKSFFAQYRLAPHFLPDRLADPPAYELSVLVLCFSPLPAKLAEHPING